jgi:predicted nucleotidyltransferase component of viral defense system
MLPRDAVIEWQNQVPWIGINQVEQDLIINRALVEIFNDDFLAENLAFRGGTAVHKLYLAPSARYSEDIDLVQLKANPVGEIFDRLRTALSFLGEPQTKQKNASNKMLFKGMSTLPPSTPIKLKIEMNSRENFHLYDLRKLNFEVASKWFSGSCQITTYQIEELLGTKLRALYQRKKGRDLFDLYLAIVRNTIDCVQVIEAYRKYIGFSVDKPPTRDEFMMNLENKMTIDSFIHDMDGLLEPGFEYNINKAFKVVVENLVVMI